MNRKNRLVAVEHGRRDGESGPRGEKDGADPTDRSKNGVKRSLLTEGHGVPIGLAIDGANPRHETGASAGERLGSTAEVHMWRTQHSAP